MTITEEAADNNEASVQPFKLEENWIDGGWCTCIWRRQTPATSSFATRPGGTTIVRIQKSVYATIVVDITQENLGPTRSVPVV